MAQHDHIHEPPEHDVTDDHGTETPEGPAGELSFDDLKNLKPPEAGQELYVHELQKRVESALREPTAEQDSPAPETGAPKAETIEPWSPRVQAICIMGGSALCWAVILAPFLLLG